MGFVLELQQPALHLSVDIDIDEDAACVVLVAAFQIVEFAAVAQVASTDGRQLHKTQALLLAAQLAAYVGQKIERCADLVADERLVDGNMRDLGGKCRVAAVVAPICVEDSQLGLRRIASLAAEVADHLAKIVGVHRQRVFAAECRQLLVGHIREAFDRRHGLDVGMLRIGEDVEAFAPRLDGIDAVALDARHILVAYRMVEYHKARAAYAHIGRGVEQPHAVDGRSGALVELSGQVLDGKIASARKVEPVDDQIGYTLAEDGVTALFEQLFGEPEQVVDVYQTELADRQRQVAVELLAKRFGLDAEARMFFYIDAIICHIGCMLLFYEFVPPLRVVLFEIAVDECNMSHFALGTRLALAV